MQTGSIRQFQGSRGGFPPLGQKSREKKRQDIFLEGQEYWEGYQAGDLNTKEQDEDYAARTGVGGGKLISGTRQKLIYRTGSCGLTELAATVI